MTGLVVDINKSVVDKKEAVRISENITRVSTCIETWSEKRKPARRLSQQLDSTRIIKFRIAPRGRELISISNSMEMSP
jgi:hypothetical protein